MSGQEPFTGGRIMKRKAIWLVLGAFVLSCSFSTLAKAGAQEDQTEVNPQDEEFSLLQRIIEECIDLLSSEVKENGWEEYSGDCTQNGFSSSDPQSGQDDNGWEEHTGGIEQNGPPGDPQIGAVPVDDNGWEEQAGSSAQESEVETNGLGEIVGPDGP
jgi:hypothetical protein